MGKTKDVQINGDGTCLFKFKDDATGNDGVFDPGANQVSLQIAGLGKASLLLSQYFFPIMQAGGIPTHYISANEAEGTMLVQYVDMFPVEFIWRDIAWGSFSRTYGIENGYKLDGMVEATLKSDDLCDPRISKDTLVLLGKMTSEQYDCCVSYTKTMGTILKQKMSDAGLVLCDFKVEFGVNKNGEILLADEISAGIWRVFKNDSLLDPLEAATIICP